MNYPGAPGTRINLVFRIVVGVALLAAFGQVTLGGVVRVTESGLACPDWPLCHGRFVPPLELGAIIEYSHRLAASVLGVLMVAVAAMAWVSRRSNRRVLSISLFGLVLVIMAGILGGITVLTELVWWVVLFHLGIAEGVLACLTIVVLMSWRSSRVPSPQEPTGRPNDNLAILVLASVLGVFALILSGSYMVGYGAGSSCGTWPLCNGSLMPDGVAYAIHMGHRIFAAAVGLLLVATTLSAWSRRSRRPELGWCSLLLLAAFTVQIIVGALIVWSGFSSQMRAIHLSLATLVWIATVSLATLTFYSVGRMQLKSDGITGSPAPGLRA